jgi:hypothetical protein
MAKADFDIPTPWDSYDDDENEWLDEHPDADHEDYIMERIWHFTQEHRNEHAQR